MIYIAVVSAMRVTRKRAIADGRDLAIEATHEAGRLRITLRDTGDGFAPETAFPAWADVSDTPW